MVLVWTIAMATSSTTLLLSSLIPASIPSFNSGNHSVFLLQNRSLNRPKKRVSFVVQAAKPPIGVCTSHLLLLIHAIPLIYVLSYLFYFIFHFVDYEAIGHVCFFRWKFQRCSLNLSLRFLGWLRLQKYGTLELAWLESLEFLL